MKPWVLQQNRRSNSFRGSSALDSSVDGAVKSPASIFWLVLHGFCCLISLILGLRFSRLVCFLLFSTSSPNSSIYTKMPFHKSPDLGEALSVHSTASSIDLVTNPESPANKTSILSSRVVVGRHGILIRPWPHPNPVEVMNAHRLIERVQKEQRLQNGVKNPRTIIAITPTYVRTFQTLHLTSVMQSLMNVPYELVWIIVEAGGTTDETASLIARSGLRTLHIGYDQKMPISWEDRHRLESKMRMRALRVVREEKLYGIVIFADDSNMHSLELFDEIQNVKWIGALSVGILAHLVGTENELLVVDKEIDDKKALVPVQGPACDSLDRLVGWHTFNSLPLLEKAARFVGERAVVLPRKLEWSGFVLNSRLLWKEVEDKPEWILDFDNFVGDGEDVENPLSLLKDPSVVEPLGSCGRKVLLWWLRVEARADSHFPARWIIDHPLEVTVPAKRTPWPDAPPELPSNEKLIRIQDTEKPVTKPRSSRSKRRGKRRHEARSGDSRVSVRHSGEPNLQEK